MVLVRLLIEMGAALSLNNYYGAISAGLTALLVIIAWRPLSRLRMAFQNGSATRMSHTKLSTVTKFDVDFLDENVPHIPFKNPILLSASEMERRANDFYQLMNHRRTLRFFSSKPVPAEIIATILKTAGTSPSAAHRQPWTYVVVSNAELKHSIREIVESEEKLNYEKRMGQKWVDDLKFVRTDYIKPYIDTAPYLILVFKQSYGVSNTGAKVVHYYSEMSVLLSVGIMLAAIQNVGLVTLTSTPLNCGPSISRLLNRPSNEKLLLLLPVGYSADDATVPDLCRKEISENTVWY